MDNKIIVTISREFGSGGRKIAEDVANRLNIEYYDNAIVEKVAQKTGFSKDYIEENDQKLTGNSLFNFSVPGSYSSSMVFGNSESLQDTMFFTESNIIKDLAYKSSCVIVGRCADYVLSKMPNCLNVFIYSDIDSKIRRVVEDYKIEDSNIEKLLKDRDKIRSKHYQYYTGRTWGDCHNYDLSINSDFVGLDTAVNIITEVALKRLNK